MLATAVPAGEAPLASPDFAFETKWDGMRVLIGVDGSELEMRTRNGIGAAARFPELAALREQLGGRRLVLDGEIVRMVEGRPNFWSLQRRIKATQPADIRLLAEEEPAELILFDLLYEEGRWLLEEPWERRRQRLEAVAPAAPPFHRSPVWDDGESLWESICSLELEGVIAKRRASAYAPSHRGADWLKIKREETLDVVVGGWTEGAGSRGETFGALLVGTPAGPCQERLDYLGHVGTGFDGVALRESLQLLAPLTTLRCPFAPRPTVNARPHWVEPALVAEIRHQGLTTDGRLRHPVFVRWRPDRTGLLPMRSGGT